MIGMSVVETPQIIFQKLMKTTTWGAAIDHKLPCINISNTINTLFFYFLVPVQWVRSTNTGNMGCAESAAETFQ